MAKDFPALFGQSVLSHVTGFQAKTKMTLNNMTNTLKIASKFISMLQAAIIKKNSTRVGINRLTLPSIVFWLKRVAILKG